MRKRIESGELEPVAEDHSSRQKQVVRLTDAQIDRLVEGYLAGKSVYQLAPVFGINRQTVSLHLKRRGVTMRRQGLAEADRPEIERLRSEGWSFTRLGERFHVHGSSVRNFVIRGGAA